MREKWCFHQPKYACDREYGELYACSPWSGLRDFAYDYVVSVQPKRVVELGTHFGSSAFAFLQAAADCHLDLELTVADTWEGDLFTGADYRREDVRSVFSEVLRSCYPDQNVRVRKMTFDEAAELDEGGIGLLHIDGSHRYEDVRHDYLRWKDLVSEDGAVFLHDTAPDLFGEQVLGSHLFWRELQAEEPYTLELPVSGGLGIVCRRKELWTFLKDILSCGRYEQNALQTDMQNKDRVRRQYFRIRDLLREQERLKKDLAELEEYCRGKERYCRELEESAGDFRAVFDGKDAYIGELEQTIARYRDTFAGKDRYIRELEARCSQEEALTAEKDRYLRILEKELLQERRDLLTKERRIGELERHRKREENRPDEAEEQEYGTRGPGSAGLGADPGIRDGSIPAPLP